MNQELVYAPGLRSADFDVLELILGCNLALAQLSDFPANIAQFLGRFATSILIHLYNLQLDFRDLAASFGLFRNQLTGFTFEPGLIALQRANASQRYQIFLVKLKDAFELLLY